MTDENKKPTRKRQAWFGDIDLRPIPISDSVASGEVAESQDRIDATEQSGYDASVQFSDYANKTISEGARSQGRKLTKTEVRNVAPYMAGPFEQLSEDATVHVSEKAESQLREYGILQDSKPATSKGSKPAKQKDSDTGYKLQPQPLNVKNRGAGSTAWSSHGVYMRKAYLRIIKGIAVEEDVSIYDVVDTALGDFLKKQGKI